MRRTSFILSSVLLFASPIIANAAAVPPIGTAVQGASTLHEAHEWHRGCEWGPYRFHRHVPGYGFDPCDRRPRFDDERDDYEERYDDERLVSRCEAWRNECRARHGWQSRRFERCMERLEC